MLPDPAAKPSARSNPAVASEILESDYGNSFIDRVPDPVKGRT